MMVKALCEQAVHNIEMQLDVVMVKKKPLDIRRLFNLEQLSCTEMSQYRRAVAANCAT